MRGQIFLTEKVPVNKYRSEENRIPQKSLEYHSNNFCRQDKLMNAKVRETLEKTGFLTQPQINSPPNINYCGGFNECSQIG